VREGGFSERSSYPGQVTTTNPDAENLLKPPHPHVKGGMKACLDEIGKQYR
jgi:hypothetical protein